MACSEWHPAKGSTVLGNPTPSHSSSNQEGSRLAERIRFAVGTYETAPRELATKTPTALESYVSRSAIGRSIARLSLESPCNTGQTRIAGHLLCKCTGGSFRGGCLLEMEKKKACSDLRAAVGSNSGLPMPPHTSSKPEKPCTKRRIRLIKAISTTPESLRRSTAAAAPACGMEKASDAAPVVPAHHHSALCEALATPYGSPQGSSGAEACARSALAVPSPGNKNHS